MGGYYLRLGVFLPWSWLLVGEREKGEGIDYSDLRVGETREVMLA